ncbi:MAG TPA: hypothetical protein VH351_05610 [Bryobacteraceae bacterium]|jgi:hypothetical protein|nr:hypothetical protein [Bryobacteraceae bacterium]
MQTINTKIVKSMILTAAFGLVATCASAATLKVNLPIEARWGSVLLSPGDYTIEYSEGSAEMKVSGVGKAVTVLVMSRSLNKPDAPSAFTVMDINGTPTIRAFQSADSGTTYYFHVKKPSQVELAKAQKHDASRSPAGMR